MRALSGLLLITLLAVPLLFAFAGYSGAGIKVFTPPDSLVTADQLPLSYNGSFIVQNDGPLEHVYVVRVAVDDPAAIAWVNVTPSGFTLAPGELQMVNFSIDIGEDEAAPGYYSVVFMPTMLPLAVEPYIDTFASYVSRFGRYNLTVLVPEGLEMPLEEEGPGGMTPVVFHENADRFNLVQYISPESGDRIVTQIDRAIRINVPSSAPVDGPVPISLSVFEDLKPTGIELMAVSPDGGFYPIESDNFTFDRTGRWGVIAFEGDTVLLGRPVDVGPGGVRLVMPGISSILAAIALLLLLAVVPIYLSSQGLQRVDPYGEIAYKASIISKYIDQFDPRRLRLAVDQLRDDYDGLVRRVARGNRKEARNALEELETLVSFELPADC
ncbi:MAG TPA: hypothetical protein VLT35_03125 [Methanocella sp.]|nr:hypothetical protein [Methanocella sp.]